VLAVGRAPTADGRAGDWLKLSLHATASSVTNAATPRESTKDRCDLMSAASLHSYTLGRPLMLLSAERYNGACLLTAVDRY
jgi:hypothetical protein